MAIKNILAAVTEQPTNQPTNSPAVQAAVEVTHEPVQAIATTGSAGITNNKPSGRPLETIKARRDSLVSYASSIKVQDDATFALAASARQDLKQVEDTFEALLRPGIQRVHKAHQEALAELNGYIKSVRDAAAKLKKEQDIWQTEKLRREREEAAKLQKEIEAARAKVLEEQLIQAAEEGDDAGISAVLERVAAPVPQLPMNHKPVKAGGASSRKVWTWEWKPGGVSKLRADFVLGEIMEEVRERGTCEWLNKRIGKLVDQHGEGAEARVGKGTISCEEVVSTGVRRKQ